MHIRRLNRALDAALLDSLADLLVEAVANGASISFMAGFSQAEARAFWAARVADPDLVILVALDADMLLGTVTLGLDMPPNQPHRGDIRKMIVARAAQGRGLGAALLAAAEAEAVSRGRTTLVLDTISNSIAARLYERCGWTRAGDIPDFALMPDGTMAPTTYYWKRL